MSKASDIKQGDKFGRLTVIAESAEPYSGENNRILICICICGAEKPVAAKDLVACHTQSCGCYKRDRTSETHFIHGEGHNDVRTPEYSAYAEMKRRCFDEDRPGYKNYGGRGITVCERWLESYLNFLEDMGRRPTSRHSLDRIDTNKSYSPDNCRWATKKVQNNNRRSNRILEFRGEQKTLMEWSEITGIKRQAIEKRLVRGWDIERALTEIAVVGKNQKFLGLEYHRTRGKQPQ